MTSRHEEKYIITYPQYLELKRRASLLMTPDSNGDNGSYVITSLYFDDFYDTALAEKLDGLPLHSKFRIRTYDCSSASIKLERKDKEGVLTEKTVASLNKTELAQLLSTGGADLSGDAGSLAAQMRKKDLRPAVVVRYRRDAFCFGDTDLRLTFDTELEAIEPSAVALFDADIKGFPVLDRGSVIMEVKYGEYLPSFVRVFTKVPCKQLSVSKYALCRQLGRE